MSGRGRRFNSSLVPRASGKTHFELSETFVDTGGDLFTFDRPLVTKGNRMKFCVLLFSSLFLASLANAVEVDASTCNACNATQKEQRARAAFQHNHQNTQYVLDLVDGDVNKYLVYRDSTCRPIAGTGKGKAQIVSAPTANAGGCGSYIAVDEEVVEPQFARKGQSWSVIFLRYGELLPKAVVNVEEIAASDPELAGMDAFDYMNNSSLRNDLHEMIHNKLSDVVGSTVAEALEELADTADKLLADGKANQYHLKLKFKDGSEVNLLVKDSVTSVRTGVPQDANNNDIVATAAGAAGQNFEFRHELPDFTDWVEYMRSLGVTVTNVGSGGYVPSRVFCSSSIADDGTVRVVCSQN
jgi:hypothetical protein